MLNGKKIAAIAILRISAPELSRFSQLGIAGFEAYAPMINKNVSLEKKFNRTL